MIEFKEPQGEYWNKHASFLKKNDIKKIIRDNKIEKIFSDENN